MTDVIADLHLHSSYSDGLFSPQTLLQMLADKGIKAFSLTDHDSVAGLSQCRHDDMTFIPGIELTATRGGREVHVLGYYIDPDSPKLVETLKGITQQRTKRLYEIVDNLNSRKNLGIDRDELEEELGERAYNRLNLARFMVKKSIATSLGQCFKEYIGDSADAYQPVDFFSPVDAIRLIHESGGLAFLAHPYHPNSPGILPELVEQGLDGVEAFHPSHSVEERRKCLDWASRLKIGVSGGSDFHGDEKSPRKLLSAGLDGERLVDFLALNPRRKFVTV